VLERRRKETRQRERLGGILRPSPRPRRATAQGTVGHHAQSERCVTGFVVVGHFVVSGADLAVEVVGAGQPLVLLHGILQDSRAWRWQIEDLYDEFTVIAWDAPGCGRSSDPQESWRFPEYAECLAELIATLHLAEPIMCGLSWGATLALEFEHQHPDVASALILQGGYAGWAGSLPAAIRDERLASCLAQSTMSPEDFVPEWMPGLFTPAAPPELLDEYTAMIADFHQSGFRTMAHALAEADLRSALPGIGVAVLLLYGDDDRRSPANWAMPSNRPIQ
jgi:pimeloyl-ACP methyl ester carboxylesterase